MLFADSLPIDEVISSLLTALELRSSVVLEATPGAGKTTRVPLALLDCHWLNGRRILMLEPRRLAARAAAGYMARTLRETVGETVGYRIRGDTRTSARTRVEVITEGVLTRMLLTDPALEEYALVIFDEFHERSLHADLGLALTLETQTHLREELRILVMSATLDGNAVAQLLDPEAPAPVIKSAGRAYPVETRYRPPQRTERLEATVSRTVRESLRGDEGDLLVFLPGAAEQRRVAALIEAYPDVSPGSSRPVIHLLHSSMDQASQDASLSYSPDGRRKIVLATSIAETSLTIPGIRVVVDSGQSRLPRYEPRVGLTRLETVRVSRASADQRRGRAGRTAAGVCYRLWDEHEEFGFQPSTRPEIIDADLSRLALDLAHAGIRTPTSLRWLDAPRSGPFLAARELLTQLGALDEKGMITPHGKEMAGVPLAPRLSHMLLTAGSAGQSLLAARIAALLEERDIVSRNTRSVSADMRTRVELLARDNPSLQYSATGDDLDREAWSRARRTARELSRSIDSSRYVHKDHKDHKDRGKTAVRSAGHHRDVRASSDAGHANDPPQIDDYSDTGRMIALAFPDRIARRRTGSPAKFLLRNGAVATLPPHDPLANEEWLAVADIDGRPPEYRILRAAALGFDDVIELFGDSVSIREETFWQEEPRAVRSLRSRTLGSILLDERRLGQIDDDAAAEVMVSMISTVGLGAMPLSGAAIVLRKRIAFVALHVPGWPEVSDSTLEATLNEWLRPMLIGARRWTDLESLDWSSALMNLLPWNLRADLDKLAPTHLEVPSGSKVKIDYSDSRVPVLAVKLQEVFGWTETPTLLGGLVPITLHLLSPAQRPVQITRDLAGFWRNSYFDVRRELRGRYPRHPWPEDPINATATRRAKPRGT